MRILTDFGACCEGLRLSDLSLLRGDQRSERSARASSLERPARGGDLLVVRGAGLEPRLIWIVVCQGWR